MATTNAAKARAAKVAAAKAAKDPTVRYDANGNVVKDKLSRDELAAEYQSAVGIIYSVPQLKGIFEKAIDEGWAPARMQAEIQNSDWYRDNSESARMAWAQETIGGADWKVSQEDAKKIVMDEANKIGANLTGPEAEALTRRYIYEGWGTSGRQGNLTAALSQEISFLPDGNGNVEMRGTSGDLAASLRSLAYANGVSFSDNWYTGAARSVANKMSNPNDYEREIRDTAASQWPVYSEKIKNGLNAYDLASPYINAMAQEFEMDASQINLQDPYIRSALTGISDKGDPAPMGLWDFQKKLRQDPRWMNTSKAQNEVTSVTGGVMQMFGLMGG